MTQPIALNAVRLVNMEIELPKEMAKLAARFSKFKLESVKLTLCGLCRERAKS